MTQYRLFFINTLSGRIERADVVEAVDDAGAVQACQDRTGYQSLELWCRARRVHCFGMKAVSEDQGA